MRRRLALLLLLAAGVSAESLWRDDGGLFGPRRFRPGDTLRIVFRTKRLVEFTTFQEEFESASLSNPDRSATMVLNFLPQLRGDAANTAKRSGRVKHTDRFDFSILCRVTAVETNGLLRIEGGHRMLINNQNETVRLTGLVDPGRITGDRVLSEDILDLELAYDRTTYKPDLFTEADFTGPVSATNLGLTEEKRRELLLRYLNQVIPLLFR